MGDIEKLLVGASEKYFNYLAETGKGLILFNVLQAEKVTDGAGKKVLYRLRSEKKLGNTDMLQIMVRDKIYLPNHVKIIFWDELKKDLFIQVVNKQAKGELEGLEDFDTDDVKIVIDLKFLVKRVEDWFKKRDAALPIKADPILDVKNHNGCSKGQMRAVEFALTESFSYIWGAPGTGKTKYVLANAVLNCFKNGKRVIIVAPTNNAIEQALRYVIELFDKYGIDRKNILRLGMPSKGFADAFPEVCGISGVSQRLIEIRKQKARLGEIQQFKRDGNVIEEIKRELDKNSSDGAYAAVKAILKGLEKDHADKGKLYAEYADDEISEIEAELARLDSEIAEQENDVSDARIESLQVIGATVDGYIGYCAPIDGEPKELFADRIFLDEAGYCNLAKAATLFSGGTPVTFLGDHFQSPPVCEADNDFIESEENHEIFVWAQSALYLSELLTEGVEIAYGKYFRNLPPIFDSMPKINLDTTYRFGQNLLDVLSDKVYGTPMKSSGKNNIVIEVIDVPRRTLAERKRENADEVNAVKNYLQTHLAELGSTAVLSPYKNQTAAIRKQCFRYLNENIFTVHGSQGREFDTVILSVSDTYDKYFTDSNNRRSNGKLIINTAVSRVKKKLVIVCDKNYWLTQKGQLLYEIIKNAND
ncbi:MAG: DEAD/DEAH box helicase family protein [Clostridiales bacterium]|jgi:DNA-binding transcriptional MerR regulator|nr:DEAD/DEAH box helicase family protein [Clostridiales bacterium]